MLTNEAIEVHLSYLRPGVEALQAGLIVLREKIDAVEEKLGDQIGRANEDRAAGDAVLGEKIDTADQRLGGKIDEVDQRLSDKIDAVDQRLSGKIDEVDQRLSDKIDAVDQRLGDKIDAVDQRLGGKIDAVDQRLSDKLDELAQRFMKLQASQDGLKWFVSSLTLLASGISIAHSLEWI